MRETDDGKIIANFVLSGGSADQAGRKWGAEILSLDGKPISDVIDATVPWSSPFSNPINKRLQQLRYATRFKMDKGQVEVKFKNPGGGEQTAKLAVTNERDSFNFSSFYAGQPPTSLPVEFNVLPNGFGYIKVNSFLDNDVLSIQVWERAIKYFNDNQVPGVILDMRNNGGGSAWLADQMAAYFFDKEIVVGNTAYYNKGSGEFYMDPGDQASMIPPPANLQYSGPVAVIVGPACASACEFFSYNMTINGRAAIVGQYPTEGAGGSVEDFMMPENIQVQLTIGRAVDAQGNVHLEGKGVVPTIKVPVTAETLLKQANGEDVVLEAAEKVVSQPLGAGLTPSGPPKIADAAAAKSALSSAPYLEDKAREKYNAADFSKPGTLAYTVSLAQSDQVIWTSGWCATTKDILESNFKAFKFKFVLDGQDVSSQAQTVDGKSGSQECRSLYYVLTDWPAGEHRLTTTVTYTSKINDGTADYAPGDYVLDYSVYVKP
ncbi:MAG: hypothetical protein HYR93_08285 [Chloroflexi bacterium]|nr:hypothetical protein [Chloroflexota bacterium]